MAKLSLAYLEGEILALKAKVNTTPKWVLYAIIVAVVVLIALYVRLGIKQAQIDKKYQNIEVLNSRFDSLQKVAAAQHLITLALLKKDSLQKLSYEGTVKHNNQQREYEKIKTDKEIADMHDLINRREYDILIARYLSN